VWGKEETRTPSGVPTDRACERRAEERARDVELKIPLEKFVNQRGDSPRGLLAEELSLAEPDIDLARAALLIARRSTRSSRSSSTSPGSTRSPKR
jgi:hypothetical protein